MLHGAVVQKLKPSVVMVQLDDAPAPPKQAYETQTMWGLNKGTQKRVVYDGNPIQPDDVRVPLFRKPLCLQVEKILQPHLWLVKPLP